MPSLLFIIGAAAVAAGCALIFLPAGVIVAGVELAAGGWLLERGQTTGDA